MSLAFSDTTNNTGIVQQVRNFMRVDATQWPTARIVNSVNNWLDTVTGYAIAADRRFQWDDTNHTKLPIGTTPLVANQVDYSFLTDEQGNAILSLSDLTLYNIATAKETALDVADRANSAYEPSTYGVSSGTPTEYDKIADNIMRLNRKPTAADASAYLLKFYFQRTGSYFAATDTTKSPGVAPLLHRGFVIAAAYDGALTLGLSNLNALATEMQKEEEKMKTYFAARNMDEQRKLTTFVQSNR